MQNTHLIAKGHPDNNPHVSAQASATIRPPIGRPNVLGIRAVLLRYSWPLLALCIGFQPLQNTRAQDSDPVLDLLVKHHVISNQEAENARAEIEHQNKSTSAAETVLSPSITEIKLYGDVRERFGINEAGATNDHAPRSASPNSGSDHSQVNRFRLRLRVGLEAKLADNWMFGFRFETSNDARSTNVTEGSIPAFNKASATTSSFITGATTGTAVSGITSGGKVVKGKVLTGVTTGKAVTAVNWGYAVFVGELYVRYKPVSWLSVTGGKMPNPMVSTPMVWDPDITPEGFAEQFSYTISPFGNSDRVALSPGKSILPLGKEGFSVDLFANFGQFVYSANSPANAFGVAGGADGFSSPDQSDTFLLAWQAGAQLNFAKAVSLSIAPTLYNYTGNRTNSSTSSFSGRWPSGRADFRGESELVRRVQSDWRQRPFCL